MFYPLHHARHRSLLGGLGSLLFPRLLDGRDHLRMNVCASSNDAEVLSESPAEAEVEGKAPAVGDDPASLLDQHLARRVVLRRQPVSPHSAAPRESARTQIFSL